MKNASYKMVNEKVSYDSILRCIRKLFNKRIPKLVFVDGEWRTVIKRAKRNTGSIKQIEKRRLRHDAYFRVRRVVKQAEPAHQQFIFEYDEENDSAITADYVMVCPRVQTVEIIEEPATPQACSVQPLEFDDVEIIEEPATPKACSVQPLEFDDVEIIEEPATPKSNALQNITFLREDDEFKTLKSEMQEYIQILSCLREAMNDCSELVSHENDHYRLICKKLFKTTKEIKQERLREYRRIVDLRKFAEKVEKLGFKTQTEGRKIQSFTSPQLPPMVRRMILVYLIEMAVNSIKYVETGTMKEQQEKRYQRDLAQQEAYNQLTEILLAYFNKITEGFEGFMFGYSIGLPDIKNGSNEQVIFESNDIYKLFGKVRKYMFQYGDDNTARSVTNILKKFSFRSGFVMVPAQDGTVKGRAIQELFENDWLIFDPRTTKHCVSDCIAVYRLWADSCEFYSVHGYIKRQGQAISEKYGIGEGATIQQLRDVSLIEGFQVISGGPEDVILDEDKPIFLVRDDHCVLCLPPNDDRAQKIYDMTKKWCQDVQNCLRPKVTVEDRESKQKEIDEDKPSKHLIVAYDFEWLKHETDVEGTYDQIAYAFGIYTKIDNRDVYYKACHNHKGLISRFVDELKFLCRYVSSEQFTTRVDMYAHNAFKADFPLFEKALLNDKDFTVLPAVESGQCTIIRPYLFRVSDEVVVKIQFLDFLNHQRADLASIGKKLGVQTQKQDVNHNIITLENYKQQIEQQKIDYYLRCDCQVLYESILAYDSLILKQYGFSFIRNNIYTASSLSKAIYFARFYQNEIQIYQPNRQQQEYAQNAYHGGMNIVFYRGQLQGVRSFDINSSYPASMTRSFPVGPYHNITMNTHYKGQPLTMGVYRCIVIESPKTLRYQLLGIQNNGLYQFPRLANVEITITSEELEYAHELGYQLYMLDGVVSETVGSPFRRFIEILYQERRALKTQMKQILKQIKTLDEQDPLVSELQEQYNILDGQQELIKLVMNSLYGKFGEKLEREVNNGITEDEDMLINMFCKGLLHSVKPLTDRYLQYSGIVADQGFSSGCTNFVIASFITARGRINLHKGIMALQREYPECVIAYCDTDSIYAGNLQKFNMKGDFALNYFSDDVLGKFKPEIVDKVGYAHENIDEVPVSERDKYAYCDGVFVMNKGYAVRNPVTGKQKITCKGVAGWIVSDEERAVDRRKDNDVTQMTYDHMVGMVEGNYFSFELVQQQIARRLLKGDTEHIKYEKLKQVTVKGNLTKGIVRSDGFVFPECIEGQIFAPKDIKNECEFITFNTVEQIEKHFDKVFDDIADEFCVIQSGDTRQYIVFLENDAVRPFLERKNQNHTYHQMFGASMMPSFDIDCKKSDIPNEQWEWLQDREIRDLCLSSMLKTLVGEFKLGKALFTEKTDCGVNVVSSDGTYHFDVVDRSRADKISMHVRLPGFTISRLSLKQLVDRCLRDNLVNPKANPFWTFVDLAIYRLRGQLRISNNELFYRLGLKQIQIQTSPAQQAYIKKKQMDGKLEITKNTEDSLKKQALKYLKDNNIEGWSIRSVAVKKSSTTVTLNRHNEKGAQQCYDCCTRKHSGQDNFLYLHMTAKKIVHKCFKCKKD